MTKDVAKHALMLAPGAVVIGFAIYLSWTRPPSPADKPPARGAKQSTLNAIGGQPIPKEEFSSTFRSAVPVADPQAAACEEQRRVAIATSASRFIDDLKSGALRLDEACRAHEAAGALFDKLYLACAYDADRRQLRDEPGCAAAAMSARATWIDALSRDRRDWRQMSSALLSNKILALFQQGGMNAEQRRDAVEMASALVEREPDLPDARKALVAARMAALGSPEQNYDEMRDAVERALALAPNDPQLAEAELLNEQLNGHPERVEAFARQYPDSALGYYYAAWSQWKAGAREAALANLARAAQLAPGDARIARTRAAALRGEAGPIFSATVGFSFGDL